MRRRLAGLTVTAAVAAAVLTSGVPPASAHRGNVVQFTAPVPGSVITPYWTDVCLGCAPDGTVRKTVRDTTGQDLYNHLFDHKNILGTGIGWEVCNAPFPPGAWGEAGIPLINGATLEYELYPLVDWDGWVCGLRPPDADDLAMDDRDTGVRWREEFFTANILGDPCDNIFGVPQIPAGCQEHGTGQIPFTTQALKLLAYNWSDLPTVEGSWHYL